MTTRKKFDFLFLMCGRTGSLAMQNFLALHPEIIAVPRLELDAALAARNPYSIAERYQQVLDLAAERGLKIGLVQHWHYWDKGISELVAEIVESDGVFQVVREPRDAFISMYNASLYAHTCAYRFDNAKLPWWSGLNGGTALAFPIGKVTFVEMLRKARECPMDRLQDKVLPPRKFLEKRCTASFIMSSNSDTANSSGRSPYLTTASLLTSVAE